MVLVLVLELELAVLVLSSSFGVFDLDLFFVFDLSLDLDLDLVLVVSLSMRAVDGVLVLVLVLLVLELVLGLLLLRSVSSAFDKIVYLPVPVGVGNAANGGLFVFLSFTTKVIVGLKGRRPANRPAYFNGLPFLTEERGWFMPVGVAVAVVDDDNDDVDFGVSNASSIDQSDFVR